MHYRDSDKPLTTIGEELGVAYVLEGTIRWDKTGDTDRVRITPQLIRVSDDTHLWADRYEAALVDIFSLQANIAQRVAEALDVSLLQSEQENLEDRPTENMEAYQAYLAAGRHEYDSIAVQMYNRAIELDPDFALAYAAVSEVHSGLYHYGSDPSPGRIELALDNAKKALSLLPDLPEGQLAMAYYYYWGFRKYDSALAWLEKAEKNLPHDARILEARAFIHRRQGKFEQAANELNEVLQLAPRNDRSAYALASTYSWLRDFDQALHFIDRAISLRPDYGVYQIRKSAMFRALGDLDRASQTLSLLPPSEQPWVDQLAWLSWAETWKLQRKYTEILEMIDTTRGFQEDMLGGVVWNLQQFRALCYYLLGNRDSSRVFFDSALSVLSSAAAQDDRPSTLRISMAMCYAGLGQKTKALEQTDLAVAQTSIEDDAIDGADLLALATGVYVMAGEYDAAIDGIETLLSMPSHLTVERVELDPFYDSLRNLPRFQRLLEKYGSGDSQI
jgi:tetratricopeptide (TPR) repeat protein